VRIGKERMKEFFRSPILWNDLLIVDMEAIRAFDKRTGELRWEVDRAAWNLPLDRGHGEHLSPKIFRAGDTDLLWCYSPSTPVAVRCVDGKSFPVEGWDHPGIMTALNPESPDTLCLGGGSYHGGWPRAPEALPYKNPPPAAIKLAFEGETLKAKVLWTGVSGRPIISDVCSLAYGQGRVVVMGNLDNRSNQNLGATVNATTGKGIAGLDAAGQRIANGAPWSRHIYAIAGGRSYGLWENKQRADDEPCEAVMGVYDLEGKKLAENRILGPRLEGEFKAMSLAAAMPNRFNYSQPFTLSGDRIYIRSNYLLHCIGEK
jgi:hypothetical protein